MEKLLAVLLMLVSLAYCMPTPYSYTNAHVSQGHGYRGVAPPLPAPLGPYPAAGGPGPGQGYNPGFGGPGRGLTQHGGGRPPAPHGPIFDQYGTPIYPPGYGQSPAGPGAAYGRGGPSRGFGGGYPVTDNFGYDNPNVQVAYARPRSYDSRGGFPSGYEDQRLSYDKSPARGLVHGGHGYDRRSPQSLSSGVKVPVYDENRRRSGYGRDNRGKSTTKDPFHISFEDFDFDFPDEKSEKPSRYGSSKDSYRGYDNSKDSFGYSSKDNYGPRSTYGKKDGPYVEGPQFDDTYGKPGQEANVYGYGGDRHGRRQSSGYGDGSSYGRESSEYNPSSYERKPSYSSYGSSGYDKSGYEREPSGYGYSDSSRYGKDDDKYGKDLFDLGPSDYEKGSYRTNQPSGYREVGESSYGSSNYEKPRGYQSSPLHQYQSPSYSRTDYGSRGRRPSYSGYA